MPQHTAFRSALPLRNNSFPCLCFAPLLRAVPSPITALHDIAMPLLYLSSRGHRLTFLASPRRGCTLHCCSMPLRLRAVYCLASALHRFVSPCIALALPCVAVPLRFTAVLCYAAAIPRSGLPRPGNSSLFNATAMSRFSSLCPRISLLRLA